MLMYTENEFYTSELVLCIYGIGKGTELWKKNRTLSQAHKQAKMFFDNKNIIFLSAYLWNQSENYHIILYWIFIVHNTSN